MNAIGILALVGGWSLRLARCIVLAMFALVPIHFFVPCEVSGTVGGFAIVLLFGVTGLSILARKFGPFAWALLAALLHVMSTH